MTRRNSTDDILPAGFLAGLRRAARRMNELGWAEANAGNVSCLLEARDLPGAEPFELPLPCPELAGRVLAVTRAGSRMHDLRADPRSGLALVAVHAGGAAGLVNGPPTSELRVHLACHSALVRAGANLPCLVHTHPTDLVALSARVPRHDDLLRLLEQAHTETALVRDRLAVLPRLVPGSPELARATAGVIALRPLVVWPAHGVLCAGPDPEAALDLIELTNKAALIALRAGLAPRDKPARTPAPKRRRSARGRPAPDGIETRFAVRSGDAAIPPAEFLKLPRRPVHVVLDNLRSAFNVGSFFRLGDAIRVAEVVTCGYTCHPPHHKLEQTALGTTDSVPHRHFATTSEALAALRAGGASIVGVETVRGAGRYDRIEHRLPVALVFGNEALGLSREVLELCDSIIELPVQGYKNSVNVATAGAVVLFDLARRRGWFDVLP